MTFQSLIQYSLLVSLLSLIACSSNQDPSNGRVTPTQKSESDIEVTKTLSLVHTQEILQNNVSNKIRLSGDAKSKSYRVRYRFNSGDRQSFQLMVSRLKVNAKGCNPPAGAFYLKQNETRAPISVVEQVPLKTDTEYELVFEVEKTDCEEFHLELDVVAWIGDLSQNPKMALKCSGPQTGGVTIFPNINFVTIYSSTQKYLDYMNTFCGEAFSNGKFDADGILNDEWPYIQFITASITKDNESRTFEFTFGPNSESAHLICKSNSIKTHEETFENCKKTILDYKMFVDL